MLICDNCDNKIDVSNTAAIEPFSIKHSPWGVNRSADLCSRCILTILYVILENDMEENVDELPRVEVFVVLGLTDYSPSQFLKICESNSASEKYIKEQRQLGNFDDYEICPGSVNIKKLRQI